jgi:TonB family protein
MRLLFLLCFVLLLSCSAPPPPVAAPEAVPPPRPAAAVEERVTGTVRVTASALNVRREASSDADVLLQVKKGTALAVLAADESWTKVRLEDGRVGWVASRFVARDGEQRAGNSSRTAPKKKGGCESDYAFVKAPTPSFSDRGAHGLVVVEANVNAKGVVTSTRVVSNNTGDESLAFLAEREIKSARFSPPMRNCQPRAFIFTYRRTF